MSAPSPSPSRSGRSSRRTHEWAWGDVGQRTVCGIVHVSLERALIVSNLGTVALRQRCRNCDRLRAAYGASSRPVASGPGVLGEPVAAAPLVGQLTERERDILEHTTGWRSKWPLYRNHFCASPGHDAWATIEGLIARGIMRKSREPSDLSGGDTVFSVTEAGVAALKRKQPTAEQPTAEQPTAEQPVEG